MATHANPAAVRKARRMIAADQYVLESTWGEINPSADEENAFLERHGWDGYGEWHLGIDEEAGEETKERYSFPFGDFRRVHRSGLVAARQRAAQFDHAEVEAAAGELLSLLDEG
ncbi:MAG: hypothetical protein H0T39_07470 [Actinobacteria bacterium]|nr:hypothetical protein [Actinomycetota bacterium]